MSKMIRLTSVAALAAAALAATPAAAAPVGSSNGDASARARILKPLTLTKTADFNLGDIILSGPAGFSTTVSLSAAGVLTCDTTKVTCAGTPTAASYNVTGTQGQVVTVNAQDVAMTNGAGGNLTLTVLSPTSVILPNSGTTGRDFNIGGELTVTDTTPDGVYTGTFDVEVDYQ